jgi:hypothetical protein
MAFIHDRKGMGSKNNEHCKIHVVIHFSEVLVRLNSQDIVCFGIYGIDFPSVSAGNQILEWIVSYLSCLTGISDYSHGIR